MLYSTIPADLLQTEIDTCWVNVAGVNPSEYIEKYAGRCPVVHLKDFKKTGSGQGKMYALIGIEEEETEEELTLTPSPEEKTASEELTLEADRIYKASEITFDGEEESEERVEKAMEEYDAAMDDAAGKSN